MTGIPVSPGLSVYKHQEFMRLSHNAECGLSNTLSTYWVTFKLPLFCEQCPDLINDPSVSWGKQGVC